MDELKTKIDLVPLSDETIKNSSYLPSELWMVQKPGESALGPFHTKALKEYSHKYQYLFETAQVYNLDSDVWKDMFSVSQFQRRKPQLVSAHNLMNAQEFYLIFRGQKNGPHTQEKVQELLDNNQITTSTQISLDKGKSWIKLYEHHSFDRRNKKTHHELPANPNEKHLSAVINKKDAILNSKLTGEMLVEFSLIKKNSVERSALRNKPKKTKEPKAITTPPPLTSTTRGKQGWKYGLSASLAIVLAVMAFNFFETNNQNDFKAEVKTEVKSINDTQRGIVKRAPASVKPKPAPRKFVRTPVVPRFRTTTTTKRRPAAQKPMRKQVTKDTFERDIENIDINDPAFQEEMSRQLANEEDGYYDDDPMPMNEPTGRDFLPEDGMEQLPQDVEEYRDENRDQYREDAPYRDEDQGFDDYDRRDRMDHEVE